MTTIRSKQEIATSMYRTFTSKATMYILYIVLILVKKLVEGPSLSVEIKLFAAVCALKLLFRFVNTSGLSTPSAMHDGMWFSVSDHHLYTAYDTSKWSKYLRYNEQGVS